MDWWMLLKFEFEYYGSYSQFYFCLYQILWQYGDILCTIAWWRHQMETFSALLATCAGNSPITTHFPAQRRVTRSFDVFVLIFVWIKGWINNREAGDLRRYRAHYDVTIMISVDVFWTGSIPSWTTCGTSGISKRMMATWYSITKKYLFSNLICYRCVLLKILHRLFIKSVW